MQRATPTVSSIVGAEALGNWVANPEVPGQQTQSASALVPLQSAALKLKFSGVPRVNAFCTFAQDTTAKTIALSYVINTFTPPIATPLFAAAGSGTIDAASVAFSRDVGQSSLNHLSWGVTLESDSAGNPANSYTFNGHTPTDGTTLSEVVVQTLTGQLGAGQDYFGFSGIAVNGTGINARFPIGSIIVVTLVNDANAGGGVVSFETAQITIQEQPL